MIILNKNTHVIVSGASWTGLFHFHKTSFLLEKQTIDKLWLFGHENWHTFPQKGSESVTLRKTADSICCQ